MADVAVTSGQLGVAMAVGLALFPVIRWIVDLTRGQPRKIEPQPLDVRAVGRAVGADECEKQHQRLDARNDVKFENLFGSVRKLEQTTAAQDATLAQMNQTLTLIDGKVTTLLSRGVK
jgi:hypothetical protein